MKTSEVHRKGSSGCGFDSEWRQPYVAHATSKQPMFVVTARYALKEDRRKHFALNRHFLGVSAKVTLQCLRVEQKNIQ